MKVEIIKGDDQRVIKYVGKFAMNAKVLSEFYRYPIVTDENHIWFLVFSGRKVVAFSAIKKTKNAIVFTSDFVVKEHRGKGFHKLMIKERMKWAEEHKHSFIKADCTKKGLKNYIEAKFIVNNEYKNWISVVYEKVS
ncbi:hypothetical protein PG326_03835 [Riemerella anatipestifer]|nr:hypothetical protein [Riemerella anatipestifer]MDY3357456.1 hypothetical protein [Riemerella anatipestifer]